MGHNERGFGPAWFLSCIEVYNTSADKKSAFWHDGWIPTEPGRLNPITLAPGGAKPPVSRHDSTSLRRCTLYVACVVWCVCQYMLSFTWGSRFLIQRLQHDATSACARINGPQSVQVHISGAHERL